MEDTAARVRVLFICLGNICRSPLAEALFRHHVTEMGLADKFEIVSSGTASYHVGEGADARTRDEAKRRGVSLDSHRARQFSRADFTRYDHLFVMDKDNLLDVLALDENDTHGYKVRLLRELDDEPDDYKVPDPYFGGPDGFARVHEIVDRSTRRLAEKLAAHHGLSPLS